MKNKKKLILVIQLIFVGLLLFNISCDKEEYSLPEVSTADVTEISQVTATGGGNVTDDGGTEVIARGVCWSTSTGPTLDDDATNDGIGTGTYTSALTSLTFGTTYYVRAFAINIEKGIAYGNELSFETAQPAGVDCPADLWDGDLDCQDDVWPSYKPTYCTGEKMDDDCSLLNVTFDFWGYGTSAEVVLELQFEPIDLTTYEGELTLLNDAFVTAEGADMTFHAGAAGTYKALSGELLIDVMWSGYYATASPYQFTITPKD
jgi:hypothetical protein